MMRTLFAFFFVIITAALVVGFSLVMIGVSFILRLTRIFSPSSRKRKEKHKETVIGADGAPVIDVMVKDPFCGTYLPKSDAVRADIRGETLYFCSTKCLSQYKKRP